MATYNNLGFHMSNAAKNGIRMYYLKSSANSVLKITEYLNSFAESVL